MNGFCGPQEAIELLLLIQVFVARPVDLTAYLDADGVVASGSHVEFEAIYLDLELIGQLGAHLLHRDLLMEEGAPAGKVDGVVQN